MSKHQMAKLRKEIKGLGLLQKSPVKTWKFQPILFEGSSEANKKAHDLVPGI